MAACSTCKVTLDSKRPHGHGHGHGIHGILCGFKQYRTYNRTPLSPSVVRPILCTHHGNCIFIIYHIELFSSRVTVSGSIVDLRRSSLMGAFGWAYRRSALAGGAQRARQGGQTLRTPHAAPLGTKVRASAISSHLNSHDRIRKRLASQIPDGNVLAITFVLFPR